MDELTKQLSAMLDNSQKFVVDQVPDVLQQFILWSRIHFTVVTAIGAITAIVTSFILWRILHIPKDQELNWVQKEWRKTHGEDCPFAVVVLVVDLLITIASIIVTFVAGYYAILVWFAPKVYLIIYAASLIKK